MLNARPDTRLVPIILLKSHRALESCSLLSLFLLEVHVHDAEDNDLDQATGHLALASMLPLAQELDLHCPRLDRSRSQRILWLLHECKSKISYDIKLYKRAPNMTAPEELKKYHPLGKSPQVSIEAQNLQRPLVLAESGTIVEYLVDHFATHLKPNQWKEGNDGQLGGETEEWMRYRYYMHFAEGSLMSLLLTGLLMDRKSLPFMAPF